MKIVLIIVAAAVLVFGLMLAFVCVRESRIPSEVPEDMDEIGAIIVLGAEVHADGSPSVQLAWRLDKAVEAWNREHIPIVVCGSQAGHEPEPEAFTMKRYLVERGIDADMIYTEPDSFNTRENLENAKAMLDSVGYDGKVLIVTSDYHAPRALALARDLGMDAEALGSPCKPEFWLKNHAREALAWVKYWLQKLGLPI